MTYVCSKGICLISRMRFAESLLRISQMKIIGKESEMILLVRFRVFLLVSKLISKSVKDIA